MKHRVLTGLACIVGVIVLLVAACFINHRIQLHRESSLFTPIGQLVEVEGGRMNVYTEGEGERTLVFLAGGGTSSPVMDFRSLYSLLSDEYRIVVVEKLGYGFSDVSDAERDLDSILENTRDALKQSGIEGPFVLCPHSMSGVESVYWAQKYPDEVAAIIGLDMAVPAAYRELPINMFTIRLGQLGAQIGITRFLGIAGGDAAAYGTLTPEEQEICRAVFYRRTLTSTMIAETRTVRENALKAEEGAIPRIPMLLFASNGQGTGMDQAQWLSFQQDFVREAADARLIELDCPHYVHNHEYKLISEEIRVFLSGK